MTNQIKKKETKKTMNKINEIIKKGYNKENKKEFKLIKLIQDLINTYTALESENTRDAEGMIDSLNDLIIDAKRFAISNRVLNAIEEAIKTEFRKIEKEVTQKLIDLNNYAKQEFNLNLKEIFELIKKYNNDYEWIGFGDLAHVANYYDKDDPFLNGFKDEDYYDDDYNSDDDDDDEDDDDDYDYDFDDDDE